MINSLLNSIQEDERTPIAFQSTKIEEKLSEHIEDASDSRKLIIIFGAPGIGKSDLQKRIKGKYPHLNSINVKSVLDEEGLKRKIEGVQDNKLFLDNFDAIFKYHFPSPKYDWASLYERNREGPRLALSQIKEFFKKPGAKLFIFIQNLAYYNLKSDFKRLIDDLANMHLFSIDSGFANILDAGQLTDTVREAFQDQNKPLTANAVLEVEQAGSKWVIDDAGTRYQIQNEQQVLKVYQNIKIIEDVYPLGLPENEDKLQEIFDHDSYQAYVQSVLQVFVNKDKVSDFPPTVFLANVVSNWINSKKKNRQDKIVLITKQQVKDFSVGREKVDNNKKIFSRLGLAYVPTDEEIDYKKDVAFVFFHKLLNIAESLLIDAGLLSGGLKNIITYFVLGIPFAFAVILSVVFIVGVYRDMPIWVSILFIMFGMPLIAVLIGWMFDRF